MEKRGAEFPHGPLRTLTGTKFSRGTGVRVTGFPHRISGVRVTGFPFCRSERALIRSNAVPTIASALIKTIKRLVFATLRTNFGWCAHILSMWSDPEFKWAA